MPQIPPPVCAILTHVGSGAALGPMQISDRCVVSAWNTLGKRLESNWKQFAASRAIIGKCDKLMS